MTTSSKVRVVYFDPAPIDWADMAKKQPSCAGYTVGEFSATNTRCVYSSAYRSGTNSLRDSKGKLIKRENAYSAQFYFHRDEPVLYEKCDHPPQWRRASAIYALSGSSYDGRPTAVEPAAVDTSLMARKLFEAYKESDFSIGVTTGESVSTRKTIASALQHTAESLRALRRGNVSQALRHLGHVPAGTRSNIHAAMRAGDVGRAWMAARYGWVPLLSDIYALEQFKYEYYVKKSIVAKSKTFGSWTKKYATKNDLYDTRCVNYYRWEAFLRTEDMLPSWGTRLGLTNPALIAWELVPFSFVVDWFIPVSNYLSGLEAIKLLPYTTITKTTTKVRAYTASPSTNVRVAGLRGVYHHKQVLVDRLVNQTLPTGFNLLTAFPRSYAVKPDTSLKRIGDVAAFAGLALEQVLARKYHLAN